MRKPDFDALRSVLETPLEPRSKVGRVEFPALISAIVWVCGARGHNKHEAQLFMAALIERLRPDAVQKRVERNARIRKCRRPADDETLFSMRQSIADDENLSAERVARIQRIGEDAAPLVGFVQRVRSKRKPSDAQMAAAIALLQDCSRRLRQDNKKSEALRRRLCIGFAQVGDSALDEETYLDIEALVAAGTNLSAAIATVMRQTGKTRGAIKKDYQRRRAKALADTDSAIEKLRETSLLATPPLIGPADMAASRRTIDDDYRHKRDRIPPGS